MRYYFVYRKYKYVNLLALDFNKALQIYKDSKKINDYVFTYNKTFENDYELSVGQVDLDFCDIKKIGSNLYARLEKENVRKAIIFFQRIEFIE